MHEFLPRGSSCRSGIDQSAERPSIRFYLVTIGVSAVCVAGDADDSTNVCHTFQPRQRKDCTACGAVHHARRAVVPRERRGSRH